MENHQNVNNTFITFNCHDTFIASNYCNHKTLVIVKYKQHIIWFTMLQLSNFLSVSGNQIQKKFSLNFSLNQCQLNIKVKGKYFKIGGQQHKSEESPLCHLILILFKRSTSRELPQVGNFPLKIMLIEQMLYSLQISSLKPMTAVLILSVKFRSYL